MPYFETNRIMVLFDRFSPRKLLSISSLISLYLAKRDVLKGTSNDKTSFIILKDLDFNNKNMKK